MEVRLFHGKKNAVEIIFIKYFIDFTKEEKTKIDMISRKKRLLLYLTNFRQIGSLFTKHEEMFHESNCNLVLQTKNGKNNV